MPHKTAVARATYAREWKAKNPELVRKYKRHYMRHKRYGVTQRRWLEILEQSDGLCALCYEEPATRLDHDHKTGSPRGALCNRCNTMLSGIEDPVFLQNATEYLDSR